MTLVSPLLLPHVSKPLLDGGFCVDAQPIGFEFLSSDHAPPLHPRAGSFAPNSIPLPLSEALPKTQGLVPGTSHNSLSVGTHRQVQYTISMSRQARYLGHAWVLPDDYLVLAVTVRGYKLIAIFRPGEVADLGSCVELLYASSSRRIPELNAAICGTTTGGKKIMLVG